MLAQGPVEFPWNPDSDGDDFIGVNDLMALLGEFDSVFSEENLYFSADSLYAFYDAGSMNYVECQMECSTLPGLWKMPRLNEVKIANQAMWIETPQREMHHTGQYFNVKYLTPESRLDDEDLSNIRECFCVTRERPKVEYTYCFSGSGIGECANEKVVEGWLPQGGIHVTRDGIVSQAFWRWAE